MKKTPYLESKRHKFWKYVLIWTIILLILCLMGCAKTASETATEAALAQTAALHEQIKKECPTASVDKQIDALNATINSQLASCEAQLGQLRERNNTLLVIILGLGLVWGVAHWAKLKARFAK